MNFLRRFSRLSASSAVVLASSLTTSQWRTGPFLTPTIPNPNLTIQNLTTLYNGPTTGVPLWGATVGYVNGNSFRTSNNNGYFIINDSDPQYGGGISQLIDGLTPGHEYELNFEYAWAQEAPAGGNTWQYIYGTFGTESFQTPTGYLPNHGFDGGPVPADGNGWYTYTKPLQQHHRRRY